MPESSPHGPSASDSRTVALNAAEKATDIGMSLTALVYALVYVGDAVRIAAGLHVDDRIEA